jgi:hypothetical protein
MRSNPRRRLDRPFLAPDCHHPVRRSAARVAAAAAGERHRA